MDLLATIEKAALPNQMPDGSLQPTLAVDQIEQLAIQFNTDNRAVEILALEHGIIPERYCRNLYSYTPEQQARLLKSCVAVIGLGGLGGTVTECLSRAGVGSLVLVDHDDFEDHNLNRQLLCTQDLIGSSKVQAAAERVMRVNSAVAVKSYSQFLDRKNAEGILNDSQVVVDCLDSIETRFVLETAARRVGIPLVSAAVAGLSGQVTAIFPEDIGLELIYGPRQALKRSKGVETTLGCLPQAVMLTAAAESAEVINVLLGQPALRKRLLMIDAATHTYDVRALDLDK
jgi:molybdopterin/thiamine biosynthesis adenylyltransferase